MNLPKSIRVGMAMRGLTQGELSAITQIHQSNLSKMVNGKMLITSERLEAISTALGMKVSEFVKLGED